MASVDIFGYLSVSSKTKTHISLPNRSLLALDIATVTTAVKRGASQSGKRDTNRTKCEVHPSELDASFHPLFNNCAVFDAFVRSTAPDKAKETLADIRYHAMIGLLFKEGNAYGEFGVRFGAYPKGSVTEGSCRCQAASARAGWWLCWATRLQHARAESSPRDERQGASARFQHPPPVGYRVANAFWPPNGDLPCRICVTYTAHVLTNATITQHPYTTFYIRSSRPLHIPHNGPASGFLRTGLYNWLSLRSSPRRRPQLSDI